MSNAATPNPLTYPLLLAGAVMAIVAPSMLAYNVPPSATFLNQALALIGWGVLGALLLMCVPAGRLRWLDPAALGATVLLVALLLGALVAPALNGLPWTFALSSAGLIGAALVVLWVAIVAARGGAGVIAADALCAGLLLAGGLSVLAALIQMFKPEWANGDLIAHATASRPGGNLRQANHLSSLLMMSACALVWATERLRAPMSAKPRLRSALAGILMFGLMLGAAITASRTGGLCAVLLAVWGLVDRSLSRTSRVLLVASPVLFVLCWFGLSEWASLAGQSYGGDAQLHSADPSSSRLGIWKNTWALILAHPLLGVGWGDFNFAWTLTPFPGRPGAFFDHTHNLALQLIVELGLPLGGALSVLALWVVWRCVRGAARPVTPDLRVARCACAIVLIMSIHSSFEYPLWYAYFLLPTAFALGLALGSAAAPDARGPSLPQGRALLTVAAIVVVLGGIFSLFDYMRVVVIFAPAEGAAPLADRIEDGQRSVFFAHHADYAAVTTADNPSSQIEAFRRATHYLLDTRLMMAWARAENELGHEDRARYLAARLKEFRNPASDEFFAECGAAVAADRKQPFQCLPPQQAYRYEDFR